MLDCPISSPGVRRNGRCRQPSPGKRARDDYLWASILNSRATFQAASGARARIRNEAIVLGALCYETKNFLRGMIFLELGGPPVIDADADEECRPSSQTSRRIVSAEMKMCVLE